jgi:signal transduction histidine kinase
MRFKAWRGLSDGYRRAVEGHSPWPRGASNPEPILVPNVYEEPSLTAFLPLFRTEGIRALGFIPLVAGGRLLGKFMVYYEAPRALSSPEQEVAKAIANHVAAGIARFEAMAELRETVRYNELFAGVLAHDLRSPLGAILTSAQLVQRQRVDPDGASGKALGRIVASSERMARMVDQLLDFTRARVGGGFELEVQETDLMELVRQVMDELETSRPEWRMRLEHIGDVRGTWDRGRLAQVVSNLVGNAGQHGRREAGIHVCLDGRAPEQAVLTVHNQGAIPAPLLPYIFDPFRRAEHREATGGLGLGLFITQELVGAHGGAVAVTSSEPEGTLFTVRLPRRAAHRSAQRERSRS